MVLREKTERAQYRESGDLGPDETLPLSAAYLEQNIKFLEFPHPFVK